MRQKQTAEKELKVQLLDLETRRQALKQDIIDAEMVAEGYRHLPRLFDEVQARGSREDLKAVLQRVVDVGPNPAVPDRDAWRC